MFNSDETNFCKLLPSFLATPVISNRHNANTWPGEKKAKLLKIRFGLAEYEPHTLEQTGKYFNIGKERVRQVEAKCLRLLIRRDILMQITK